MKYHYSFNDQKHSSVKDWQTPGIDEFVEPLNSHLLLVGMQNDATTLEWQHLIEALSYTLTTSSGEPFFTTLQGQTPLGHTGVILRHIFEHLWNQGAP